MWCCVVTIKPLYYHVLTTTANRAHFQGVSFDLTPTKAEQPVVRDALYDFTFKLHHLYFNWTGPISVPAPCQNARKCAQMFVEIFSDEEPPSDVSQRLQDNFAQTMFYL